MVLTPIMFLATGINPAQFIHAPIQTRRTAKILKKNNQVPCIAKYLLLHLSVLLPDSVPGVLLAMSIKENSGHR